MAIMQVTFRNDPNVLAYIQEVKTVLKQAKVQQPRVLTLDELDDLRGRGQAVYYEDRDATAKCQDVFYLAAIGEYVYLKGETYVLPKRVDQYGKTWRCWTSRPDKKVMSNTPW